MEGTLWYHSNEAIESVFIQTRTIPLITPNPPICTRPISARILASDANKRMATGLNLRLPLVGPCCIMFVGDIGKCFSRAIDFAPLPCIRNRAESQVPVKAFH